MSKRNPKIFIRLRLKTMLMAKKPDKKEGSKIDKPESFNHNSNHKKDEHAHPVFQKSLTFSQKASDRLTEFCGSWTFIISVFIIMAIWMSLNVLMLFKHWDPYPFILLNFVLSCLAAVQAPIILMSQNRQAERDRINAKYDYQVNRKAEREIQQIGKELKMIRKSLRRKA